MKKNLNKQNEKMFTHSIKSTAKVNIIRETLLAVILATSLSFSQEIWTKCYSKPTYSSLNSVIYANGKFVAVGENGTIIYSPDGTSWTAAKGVDTLADFYSVCYGANRFVAVGYKKVLTSVDGIKWVDSSVGVSNYSPNSVIWGGNQFVAVGIYYKVSGTIWTGIVTSSDGKNWVSRPIEDMGFSLRYVAWGNNKYITFARMPSGMSFFFISSDGISWGNMTIDKIPFRSVQWLNNRFVCVGDGLDYDANIWYFSTDGTEWTGYAIDTGVSLRKVDDMTNVIWVNNHYFWMGGPWPNDTVMSFSSPDGIQWTRKTAIVGDTFTVISIAASGNKIVVVGSNDRSHARVYSSQYTAPVAQPAAMQKNSGSITISQARVCYALSFASPVAVRIFDIHGRLASTLINGIQPAGDHTIALPRNLAQGRYVVSLRAGSIKVDKAMVIAR